MSTSTGNMPKSILKKTKSPEEKAQDAAAARNMELALYHARLIQLQKDAEKAILDSIEALIEFPHYTRDISNPDPRDVQEVKNHLGRFRPSDFDSAIEERNCDDKCGYMLCPKPRMKQKGSARYRLLQRQNLQVIEAAELEKWCSQDCAKRALYLRVQLSESSPWLRSAMGGGGLQLYGEAQIAQKPEELADLTNGLEQLALERGDQANSFREKSMDIDIQERFDALRIEEPVAPSLATQRDGSNIEGYVSGMVKGRIRDPLDLDLIKDRGDMLDTI